MGLVLAAGRSRRMGSPKALLPVDGRSLLQRWIEALRDGGCEEVRVVVGGGEAGDRIAREAAPAALVVRNPDPGSEQIDSLRIGLRALPSAAEAVVATPVDVAEQSPEVVRAVVEAWRRRGSPIVLPTWQGERGHPALFARAVFPELLADPLPEGARSVVNARPERVEEVEVDRPGILRDLDTPDDYRRLLEGR